MSARYKISFITLLAALAFTFGMNTVYAQTTAYIELYYGNQKFVFRDEYISPTNHLVAEEIFERGINAPLGRKLEIVSGKLRGGATYKAALLYCFPLLGGFVDDAIKKINSAPVDSMIKFDPNAKPMFVISREKDGVEVDEDRLYMDIYFALSAGEKASVAIPVRKLSPRTRAGDNIALTGLRTRYSTDFSTSTDERKHNISLAASKINGSVIDAGSVLSFNEKVGRRTAKNGFLESKIIKGGKYVAGIGGGVCQVSTTLYNAALMSDLEVVKVSRHSLQSSYEMPSFDAMVNSGSSDLAIKNTGDTPVFIRAFVSGTRVFVEVYGAALPYTIKRESEITFKGETPPYDEVTDTIMEYFEEGTQSGTRKTISYSHPEVHSNGYLLYYDKRGNLLERKLIRRDVYNSVRGVIAVAP